MLLILLKYVKICSRGGKLMKKIFVLIAILFFPFYIFAKEVNISDVNMKFNIDDDYIVLTRDNLNDNNDLKNLGISDDYMKDTMERNNIYADILSKDISFEILIVVPNIKLSFYDLSSASDSMQNDLKSELEKKTKAEISSIYKGKRDYIVIDYFDENTDYYIVNYYTIVNARGYNIQLQKKTEITDEEKDELKKLVDNIDIETIANNETSNGGLTIKNIIIGAVIGAAVGVITYSINMVIKKKKINENNVNSKKKSS